METAPLTPAARLGTGLSIAAGLTLIAFFTLVYYPGSGSIPRIEPRALLVVALCHAGFLAGWFALQRLQAPQVSRLSRLGFALAALAVAFYLFGGLGAAVSLDWRANVLSREESVVWFPMAMAVGGMLFRLGALLGGIGAWRSRRLPAWAALLLLLDPVISVLLMTGLQRLGFALLGVLWAGIGLVVWAWGSRPHRLAPRPSGAG